MTARRACHFVQAAWFTTLLLLIPACGILPAIDLPSPSAAGWPADIESVLVQAAGNRSQLEAVLIHCRDAGDAQKFDAACFLVRHMPGHGFIQYQWVDEQGREVPFDALAYASFRDASGAMKKLEEQHGKLKAVVKEMRLDIHVIESDYLIDHIDRAFAVYRGRPWCKAMPFDIFCDYILPYRSTNEPLASWRAACEIDVEKVLAKMTDPGNVEQAEGAVTALSPHKVGFLDLYYLNRNDQSFDDMVRKPLGRCEDQQTMRVYLLRANGIPVAGDYTPWWATRDNNHAWDVVLSAKGFGRAGLSSPPAKIFRKTFSRDPSGLPAQLKLGAAGPRELTQGPYRDVTDQYVRAKEITATLTVTPPPGETFAYAAVFNGGQWRIVHFGRITGERVTFDRMGFGIVYLPVYLQGGEIVPAGPPLLVSDIDGSIHPLAADPATVTRLTASAGNRGGAGDRRLQVWTDQWVTLAENLSPQAAQAMQKTLPANHLYRLVTPDNAAAARPFTVESDGRVKTW